MAELTDLVRTTELDAVNIMLSTIGEPPVSTLTSTGLTDVSLAKSTLARISRRVQAEGWDFNTDVNLQLALDVDGKIPVPPNALRIDPTSAATNLVERAGFMYDKVNNTFVLSQAHKFDIIRYFAFEDLPEAARYYIAIKAARVFQKEILGDETVDKFTHETELRARQLLEEADSDTAERNMLNDPELFAMNRLFRNPSYYF